jgi:predicted ATP-grasp superfamily ATP-dependent carboligase
MSINTLPSKRSLAQNPHSVTVEKADSFQALTAILKNLGTLFLLALAFPFNLTLVAFSLLWSASSTSSSRTINNPRNILIAGGRMTKALLLARSFHSAGHRVILIDTEKFWHSGNQYSNSVAAFYTVPDPGRDFQGYVETLRTIAKKEQVDLFIPVAIFAVLYYDGIEKHPLEDFCEVCHFDAETIRIVDDKFEFVELARLLGLSVPKSFRITSPEQVLNFDFSNEKHQYILKSIPYDSFHRLDLTRLPCATPEATTAFVNRLPISESKPWIMQEFIPGEEYCTHSTVRDGRSTLYCCASSSFQVNYEQVDKPEIKAWIDRFLSVIPGTGQASFDFIQSEDGTAYAIECNPRTHSAITLFYNHPGVAEAYLNPEAPSVLIQPDSKPTYWLYHELWRLNEVRSPQDLRRWVNGIRRGKEAVFEVDDPLPFLLVHHWQIPLELLDSLRKLKNWVRIDFNIGELIQ